MMETYYAGVYWGVRKETAMECAQRARNFFEALSTCDPSFGQWYTIAKRKADKDRARGLPGLPVDTSDVAQLEALFQRGRNRTDVGRKVIEELGFGLMAWNSKKGETLLQINCGTYSPHSTNVCKADLPSEGPSAERLLDAPALARVLTTMARGWDPDYGVATSHEVTQLLPRTPLHEADVGWVMYFSRRRGRVPPLPAPVRIEPVGTEGTLVTLTPERFTAANPEHVALALRVRELLGRAGLLQPPAP
jgi:hypothetical protein